MTDYRLFDISDLDEGTRMRLGRVFVSTEAQRFFDAMTNGEGDFQRDHCIQTHAVLGGRSTFHVGDVLHIDSTPSGRTYVWLESEKGKPPILGYLFRA